MIFFIISYFFWSSLFLIFLIYRLIEGEAAVLLSRRQKDKEKEKDKPSFLASLNTSKDKDRDRDIDIIGDVEKDRKDENEFDIDTTILSDGKYI